jgi:heme/copper-type cytochrome/quinol oxidase subunit 2
MQPGMVADAAGAAGIVVGTFLPVAIGLFLLGVGYRRRRWHREGVDTDDDGQRVIVAGWVVAGIGLVGLLTVAAASQR